MLYMITDSRNNDHSSIEEGTADREQYTTLEENVEEEVSIEAHLREIQERMVFIQSNVATMESLELNMIEEYLDDVDGARDDENGTICGDVLKDDVGSLESSQIQEYLNDNDAHDDEDGTTRKEILKYDVGCDDNAPEGVMGETIGHVLENGEPVMASLSAVDETSAWSAGSGGGCISSPGETWHSDKATNDPQSLDATPTRKPQDYDNKIEVGTDGIDIVQERGRKIISLGECMISSIPQDLENLFSVTLSLVSSSLPSCFGCVASPIFEGHTPGKTEKPLEFVRYVPSGVRPATPQLHIIW